MKNVPDAKWWHLLVTVMAIFLAGCVAQPARPFRPVWIDDPGIGVSASAGMHVRGKVAQEELATQRAREEYAKRFGVMIDSELIVLQSSSGGHVSLSSAKSMQETTRQHDVRAQVKAKWRDPESDVFWIWLVPAGN